MCISVHVMFGISFMINTAVDYTVQGKATMYAHTAI